MRDLSGKFTKLLLLLWKVNIEKCSKTTIIELMQWKVETRQPDQSSMNDTMQEGEQKEFRFHFSHFKSNGKCGTIIII